MATNAHASSVAGHCLFLIHATSKVTRLQDTGVEQQQEGGVGSVVGDKWIHVLATLATSGTTNYEYPYWSYNCSQLATN